MTLCKNEECTGCMACYNACRHGAITIEFNDRGFKEPRINEEYCVDCGLCKRSCPVLSNPSDNEIVGKCYAAYAIDNDIRTTSSSGGIFGVAAREIIQKGGIVYGACFDENMELCHKSAETAEELRRLQGSKYTQSYIGETYRNVKQNLLKDREVLFVGTPCQVAGLRTYLQKKYENLHLIDILCHGVTSPLFFESYLKKAFPGKAITDMIFRNYSNQSYDCIISYRTCQGIKTVKVFGTPSCYLSLFQKGLAFREACYECKFNKLPRQGDITLGDFWGIGQRSYEYNPPRRKGGTSFMLLNNIKGEKFVNSIRNQLYIEQRTVDEAILHNPNITGPSIKPKGYFLFYKDFQKYDLDTLVNKYSLRVFKKDSIIKKIIKLLHTIQKSLS